MNNDKLPALPAPYAEFKRVSEPYVKIIGYNAEHMKNYGAACYALGRGAAVREYIESGAFKIQHPDDDAIDRFAVALKDKMAESRATSKRRSSRADAVRC